MFVATLQILLSGVFAVSALGKALDLDGTLRALTEFGLPSRLARSARFLLPSLELVVAVFVSLAPAARFGAFLAVLLLAAFCVVIARALIAGRTPDCHCFGSLHSAPAGPDTLVRNMLLLAAAATVALVGVRHGVDQPIGHASPTALGLAATSLLCLVLAAWSVSMWQKIRRAEAAAEPPGTTGGLPVGARAPDFAGALADGRDLTLTDLLARGRPVVLVLVHPGCGPCQDLVPRLARWAPSLESLLTLAVVSAGDFAVRDAEDLMLLTVAGYEVAASFETLITPTAILLDSDGFVQARPAVGALAIEHLVRSSLETRAAGEVPAGVVERG